MFAVVTFMAGDWFFKGLAVLVAAILVKDLLHCFSAEFTIDEIFDHARV